MKRTLHVTLVFVFALTATAFAEEKTAENKAVYPALVPALAETPPVELTTPAQFLSVSVSETKIIDEKPVTEFRSVPVPMTPITHVLPEHHDPRTGALYTSVFNGQPLAQQETVVASTPQKRIARAVYFSRATLGDEGTFDEMESLFSEVAVGKFVVYKDGEPVGGWFIMYGPEETVTELANVLELIAKGAPEGNAAN